MRRITSRTRRPGWLPCSWIPRLPRSPSTSARRARWVASLTDAVPHGHALPARAPGADEGPRAIRGRQLAGGETAAHESGGVRDRTPESVSPAGRCPGSGSQARPRVGDTVPRSPGGPGWLHPGSGPMVGRGANRGGRRRGRSGCRTGSCDRSQDARGRGRALTLGAEASEGGGTSGF